MAHLRRTYNIATSMVASAWRGSSGISVLSGIAGFKRPAQTLVLYSKETCPYSRETLSMLDLDARIRPCPSDGKQYRSELKRIGGKEQVPFLIDPNTDTKMYETKDIINYLFSQYGPGADVIPSSVGPGSLSTYLSIIPWHHLIPASFRRQTPSTITSSETSESTPTAIVDDGMILWSYENCPYCRVVREVLDEKELAYQVKNIARGSPKRDAFIATYGRMQVPLLIDERKGRMIFESSDIIDYLHETYPK
ncbi:hypothetical protein PROFUN_05624 [Planoprotostelium fungivorum]|uniref:GST N-terminal domain-containing protein n=1 Tax=Planoprotostelium fungivorum TaxID=1890364 RepID=A0A2P6MUE2_9EUKA|nr:hypothetical protein PROFUN_05624 [Planoprotostelium fungivorum]